MRYFGRLEERRAKVSQVKIFKRERSVFRYDEIHHSESAREKEMILMSSEYPALLPTFCCAESDALAKNEMRDALDYSHFVLAFN